MRYILLVIVCLSVLQADIIRNNNVGIVSDTTTNLQWQDDIQLDNIGHSIMNWQKAKEHCAALKLGGHKDWRLPNVKELTSIVDKTRGEYNPKIVAGFIFTNNYTFWSDTLTFNLRNYEEYGLVINFLKGTKGSVSLDKKYHVRCVRKKNASPKINKFVRDNKGVVTDKETKLQWQDNIIVPAKKWKQAEEYCKTLTLGGYQNWRLPEINELEQIVDDLKVDSAIVNGFIKTRSRSYWSTTSKNSGHWYMNFRLGKKGDSYNSDSRQVRCIRNSD